MHFSDEKTAVFYVVTPAVYCIKLLYWMPLPKSESDSFPKTDFALLTRRQKREIDEHFINMGDGYLMHPIEFREWMEEFSVLNT